MSELLTKFLDKIGTPAELKAQLLADEPKEDFDFEAAIAKYQDDRKEVWRAKLKGEFGEQIKNKGLVITKQLARKLAKMGNLEISGNEAEEKGFDAVLDLVVEKISAGAGDDSEFKTKYEDTLVKLKNWQEKYETSVKDHEKKVSELETGYNTKIAGYDRATAFSTVFGGIEYGVDDKGRTLFESHVRNLLADKYNIKSDGALLAPDGTSKAVSLNGEGIYENLKEPVLELAKEFGVLKESNGQPGGFRKPGGGQRPVGSGSGEGDDKKFKATNALAERMAAAQNKRR